MDDASASLSGCLLCITSHHLYMAVTANTGLTKGIIGCMSVLLTLFSLLNKSIGLQDVPRHHQRPVDTREGRTSSKCHCTIPASSVLSFHLQAPDSTFNYKCSKVVTKLPHRTGLPCDFLEVLCYYVWWRQDFKVTSLV